MLEEVLDCCPPAADPLGAPADPLLLRPGLARAQPEAWARARHRRDTYHAKLRQLLDEYGVENEAELLSGHALSIRRITEMERQDYSFYHADRLVSPP